jgi:hypothetical protein
MKKILFLALFAFIYNNYAHAQDPIREAGIRGGLTSGFTYRQYLHESLSYEAILSYRKSGMQITLLRQVHEMHPYLDLPSNFDFIYGYGAHAGYYYSDKFRPFGFNDYYYPRRKFSPLLGVDFYAGIEYSFDSFPVLVGFDFKPFFEFSLYQYFKLNIWDFAFTAKYRF